jgi:hypothetical protein
MMSNKQANVFFFVLDFDIDRLCGLVVRVPHYRTRDPVSIPSDTRCSEKELIARNNSSSGLESLEYGRGNPLRWPPDTLYP